MSPSLSHRHGPAKVAADELQLLVHTVLDIGVANRLVMFDHRYATHHGLLVELVQCL